jgi:protein TonB
MEDVMSVYAKGGYLDQKTRSPLSLGAAIAINGVMIGALLFANPDFIPQAPKVFKPIWVHPDPPPPELDPPPPQEPRPGPQPQRPIEQVTPTDTLFPPEGTAFTPPKPPEPIGTGIPEGTGFTTVTPPHEPVFVGAQINPRYRNQLQPAYPPGKIRSDEEGVVEVRVLIGADGRVKQVQKISATDEAFYRATEEQALRRWRFLPATRDGVAVESWQVKTVRFRLDQI